MLKPIFKILFIISISCVFNACYEKSASSTPNSEAQVTQQESKYTSCTMDTKCPGLEACITVDKIGKSVCITSEEACKIDCGDKSCVVKTSNPGQTSCSK